MAGSGIRLDGNIVHTNESLARIVDWSVAMSAAVAVVVEVRVDVDPDVWWECVPPDDVDALTVVLRRLIASPAERERLAAGARGQLTSGSS